MALVFCFMIIKSINIAKDPVIKEFPETCEPEGGCARVMIYGFNHRDNKVDTNNLFTINHLGVHNTEDIVKGCIDDQSQGRIEYVNGTSDTNTTTKSSIFYHVNYSSIFWGFVDDMSIQITTCDPEDSKLSWYQDLETSSHRYADVTVGVQIQSQLRLGSSDFGVNPKRIAKMYKCLNKNIPDNYISDRGAI